MATPRSVLVLLAAAHCQPQPHKTPQAEFGIETTNSLSSQRGSVLIYRFSKVCPHTRPSRPHHH